MSMRKETKRERFVRVAETRTAKVISMIRLIGNCSNRAVYEYSEADLEKIFGTIENSLVEARQRYKNAPIGTKEVFSLN